MRSSSPARFPQRSSPSALTFSLDCLSAASRSCELSSFPQLFMASKCLRCWIFDFHEKLPCACAAFFLSCLDSSCGPTVPAARRRSQKYVSVRSFLRNKLYSPNFSLSTSKRAPALTWIVKPTSGEPCSFTKPCLQANSIFMSNTLERHLPPSLTNPPTRILFRLF